MALVFEEKHQEYCMKVEFVGWKGKNSLRAYVPKNERIHYLRLLGCDTSKYEKNKFEERRAKGWKRDGDSEETNGNTKENEDIKKPIVVSDIEIDSNQEAKTESNGNTKENEDIQKPTVISDIEMDSNQEAKKETSE